MKALVLGMGNPILSDDGVGLIIARRLVGRISGVEVVTTAMVGLGLLDILDGYEMVFIVDAVSTDGKSLGEVKRLEGGNGALHLFTSHGLDFFDIMKLGKDLGYVMPEATVIYGIEIGDHVSFSMEPSPDVQRKMDEITEKIVEDIRLKVRIPQAHWKEISMAEGTGSGRHR